MFSSRFNKPQEDGEGALYNIMGGGDPLEDFKVEMLLCDERVS